MSELEHMMERIGRVLTADRTLGVSIRGDQAYATSGQIVLPAIERYEHLGSENAERLLHGLIDHECGHATDSDFELFAKAAARSDAFKHLLNAIEDVYIEGRQACVYPGAGYNLAKKNDWFWHTDLHEEEPSMQRRLADPKRSLYGLFLASLTLGYRTNGGPSVAEIKAINPTIGAMLEHCADAMAPVLASFEREKQTQTCLDAAEKIWALFESDEILKGTPLHVPGAGTEAIGAYTKSSAPVNPEQAIAFLVAQIFDQPDNDRPYVVFDPSFDLERDFTPADLERMSAEYEHLRKQAEYVTAPLAEVFEAALRDRQCRRLSFDGDEEGQIDVAALGEYAVGSLHVEDLWIDYRAEDEGDLAAVAILVDCSGSMLGEKTELARLSAIACHEALKRAHVPHEISGFTTISDGHRHRGTGWLTGREAEHEAHFERLRQVCIEAHNRGTDLSKFARTCAGDPNDSSTPLCLPIYGLFKPFDMPDSRGLAYINGSNANLDGEAVLWQARRLARRPERRKALIVLSDGYPAGSHNTRQGERYLKEAIERTLAAGIETYGIGIKSDAVREFYPHWWVCRDLQELPSLMFTALLETVVEVGSPWAQVL